MCAHSFATVFVGILYAWETEHAYQKRLKRLKRLKKRNRHTHTYSKEETKISQWYANDIG